MSCSDKNTEVFKQQFCGFGQCFVTLRDYLVVDHRDLRVLRGEAVVIIVIFVSFVASRL